MNVDDVRERLRNACQSAGSNAAFASQHGLSGSYVGDVLLGRRDPGQGILDALGMQRIVSYVPVCELRRLA